MKKATHLILHGSYGAPSENWTPWLKGELEKQAKVVLAPQFPVDNWDEASAAGKEGFVPKQQTLRNWLDTFAELLPLIDTEDLTIIAHSLAPLFVLHILQTYPDLKLKNVLFVAPFLGKLGDIWQIEAVNKSFYAPDNFDYTDFSKRTQQSHVFYSDNDPYVPEVSALDFAEKVNATLHLIDNAGHFNNDSGYSKFPELLKYL